MDPQTAAWCRTHLDRIGQSLERLKALLDDLGVQLDDFLDGAAGASK